MTTIAAEDFPYTIRYASELLGVDESTLSRFSQALAIEPKAEVPTGRLVYSYHDVEKLRKAIEMHNRGEDLPRITEQLTGKAQATITSHPELPVAGRKMMERSGQGLVALGKDNESLAVIVESVSQAKESILKDLSRLLDDKLAGLDEVVVELIRCKSENDALKLQLKNLANEKEGLEQELSKFQPVQFGFYKKVR